MLEHAFVDQDGLHDFVFGGDGLSSRYDCLVITSQRAVEAVGAVLARAPSAAARARVLAMPAYTVGPATAALLASVGFSNVLGAGDAGNGSVLADIIVADATRQGALRCIFFPGRVRKDVLPQKLRAAAAVECDERVVYESRGVEGADAALRAALDAAGGAAQRAAPRAARTWVVFFAPGGADAAAATVAGRRLPAAAIGPTSAEFLAARGVRAAAVAAKPDPASLLAAIAAADAHDV
ncbi:tetrapyrrole biosynthesis, uroporphyrinogen III synthase [Dipodascopsis tothii]|uniref:tetrapyrrole biosynthesis, uroporphyrinogen III synthase n=1 Tax=Dipodascopsis tothii TaxID=44089 RepID=UPI0034D00323